MTSNAKILTGHLCYLFLPQHFSPQKYSAGKRYGIGQEQDDAGAGISFFSRVYARNKQHVITEQENQAYAETDGFSAALEHYAERYARNRKNKRRKCKRPPQPVFRFKKRGRHFFLAIFFYLP